MEFVVRNGTNRRRIRRPFPLCRKVEISGCGLIQEFYLTQPHIRFLVTLKCPDAITRAESGDTRSQRTALRDHTIRRRVNTLNYTRKCLRGCNTPSEAPARHRGGATMITCQTQARAHSEPSATEHACSKRAVPRHAQRCPDRPEPPAHARATEQTRQQHTCAPKRRH